VTEGWRKLSNEALLKFCRSINIIRIIKSSKKYAGYVADIPMRFETHKFWKEIASET
jgi:hypothetical protein